MYQRTAFILIVAFQGRNGIRARGIIDDLLEWHHRAGKINDAGDLGIAVSQSILLLAAAFFALGRGTDRHRTGEGGQHWRALLISLPRDFVIVAADPSALEVRVDPYYSALPILLQQVADNGKSSRTSANNQYMMNVHRSECLKHKEWR